MILYLFACAPTAEVQLSHPGVTAAIMARVDLDGDGVVSASEYAQLAFDDEPMSRWDKDASRDLDPHEIETAFLEEDPVRLQLEHRRRIYQEHGGPFAGEELEEGEERTRPRGKTGKRGKARGKRGATP